MNQQEKDLRIELAACYRIFEHMGWDELIYNHITVRIPGDERHFLINPYGLHYSEVTASNLVKVDIEGNVVEPTDYAVNPAGMLIHSTIHSVREDAHCIGHIHSDAGMAIACQQDGLRFDNFYSALLYERVAYHDFNGLTVNESEKALLVESIGDKNMLILRNHGLLTCGDTICEMFYNMFALQRSCEIQMRADSTGRPLIPVSQSIGKQAMQLMKKQNANTQHMSVGRLEFDAMRRIVDRTDVSYNDL